MREGAFTFYRVQHEDSKGRWCDSDVGHFLFAHLSFEQKRSEEATRRRELAGKENPLWQKLGEHGFLDMQDAIGVYLTMYKDHPDRNFRIIRIHQTKSIEQVVHLTRNK